MEPFHGETVVVTEKMDGENCLSPDTYVDTPNGKIKISELNCGDLIYSFNHECETVEIDMVFATRLIDGSESDEWFEIEVDNKNKIIVTGDHFIFSKSRNSYVRVSDLKINEEVIVNEMFSVRRRNK